MMIKLHFIRWGTIVSLVVLPFLAFGQAQKLVNNLNTQANHLQIANPEDPSEKRDFYVPSKWMDTKSAQQMSFKSGTIIGVAEQLPIRNDSWTIDSLKLALLAYKNSEHWGAYEYMRPKFDSVLISIWKGIPFEEGSQLVYGADLKDGVMSNSLPSSAYSLSYEPALRYGSWEYVDGEKTKVFYPIIDEYGTVSAPKGEMATLSVKFPESITLDKGLYYICFYVAQSPAPGQQVLEYSSGPTTMLNAAYKYSEEPVSGKAMTVEPHMDLTTPIYAGGQNQASLSLDVYGSSVGESSIDNDIKFASSFSVDKSCDMSSALMHVSIKNEGEKTIYHEKNAVAENLYPVFYLDIIMRDNQETDTISYKAKYKGEQSDANWFLAKGQEAELTLYSNEEYTEGFNFGSLKANNLVQLRVELEKRESDGTILTDIDDWKDGNGPIARYVLNPGQDITVSSYGDPRWEWYADGNRNTWKEYPLYTEETGGWNFDGEKEIPAPWSGELTMTDGILWSPGTTDDETKQDWLLSDCVKLKGSSPYSLSILEYIVWSEDTVKIEVGIGTSVENMRIVGMLTVNPTDGKLSDNYGGFVLPQVAFQTLETEEGIYNIGFRYATPKKPNVPRPEFFMTRFRIFQAPLNRLEVENFFLPSSACDLENSSISLALKNTGIEGFKGSIKATVTKSFKGEAMEPLVSILENITIGSQTAEAKMIKIPVVFDERGDYSFAIQLEWSNDGKDYQAVLDKYGTLDRLASEKVTKISPIHAGGYTMGFEKEENHQSWNSIWEGDGEPNTSWFVAGSDRNKIGRDGSAAAMMTDVFGTPTVAYAWMKSTCFEMSKDSTYKVSVWVAWAGDGGSETDPNPGAKFSISHGVNASIEGLRNSTILSDSLITETTWKEMVLTIKPQKDSVYYFGFLYNRREGNLVQGLLVDDFSISSAVNPVPNPSNVAVSNISQTGARISFAFETPLAENHQAVLELNNKIHNINKEGEIQAITTPVSLTSLSPDSTYKVSLYALSLDGRSSDTIKTEFKTLEIPMSHPGEFAADEITDSSALLMWTVSPSSNDMKAFIIYGENKVEATENPYRLSGLKSDTEYALKLYLQEQSGKKRLSDTVELLIKTSQRISIEDTREAIVKAYPNPLTGSTLHIVTEAAYDMELIDLSGRVLIQRRIQSGHTSLDLSKLSQGFYLLKLHNETAAKTLKIKK